MHLPEKVPEHLVPLKLVLLLLLSVHQLLYILVFEKSLQNIWLVVGPGQSKLTASKSNVKQLIKPLIGNSAALYQNWLILESKQKKPDIIWVQLQV